MTQQFQWPWETPEPGIYFNMPFPEYISARCLNAGGLKRILVSEPDFWFRSWMYPYGEEIDDDTKAKQEGRAYHMRILEGESEFYNNYAPAFEDPGDPDILRGNREMTQFLRENGAKGYSGKTAEQLAEMCLDVDPSVKLIKVMEDDHKAQYPDREFLDAMTVRQIEYANHMIEHHPELKTYFAGGYPEVTIIWDDPDYNVRFKIRIDYLKIGPVCDLKTFANQMQKAIEKAIDHAVASHKYHIQGWLYLRGVNMAKQFVREGRIFGADGVDQKWLDMFAEKPAEEFWYVFMQKGIAPVARGAKWHIRDEKFNGMGRACIEQGAQRFIRAYQTFGEGPWVDITQSKFLSFDDLPAFVGDV